MVVVQERDCEIVWSSIITSKSHDASVHWSPCPCYRTRLTWSIDDCWRYWNSGLLRRNSWSYYHHYRWCPNWLRYRHQWYGKMHTTSSDLRYFTTAQQQTGWLYSYRSCVWIFLAPLDRNKFQLNTWTGSWMVWTTMCDSHSVSWILSLEMCTVFFGNLKWSGDWETGSALKILTGGVLSQIGMTVLQATVMTGLMSALQWPTSA